MRTFVTPCIATAVAALWSSAALALGVPRVAAGTPRSTLKTPTGLYVLANDYTMRRYALRNGIPSATPTSSVHMPSIGFFGVYPKTNDTPSKALIFLSYDFSQPVYEYRFSDGTAVGSLHLPCPGYLSWSVSSVAVDAAGYAYVAASPIAGARAEALAGGCPEGSFTDGVFVYPHRTKPVFEEPFSAYIPIFDIGPATVDDAVDDAYVYQYGGAGEPSAILRFTHTEAQPVLDRTLVPERFPACAPLFVAYGAPSLLLSGTGVGSGCSPGSVDVYAAVAHGRSEPGSVLSPIVGSVAGPVAASSAFPGEIFVAPQCGGCAAAYLYRLPQRVPYATLPIPGGAYSLALGT